MERYDGESYCPDCTRVSIPRRTGLAAALLAGLAVLLTAAPGPGADLSITAASVAKSTNATTVVGTAGATITAGEPLYIYTDGTLKTAQATSAAASTFVGISLNGASSGQPVVYQTGGTITIGATVAQGTIYVVAADNAGAIAPWADLGSGNYVTVIGYAPTTTTIVINPILTGVTHARLDHWLHYGGIMAEHHERLRSAVANKPKGVRSEDGGQHHAEVTAGDVLAAIEEVRPDLRGKKWTAEDRRLKLPVLEALHLGCSYGKPDRTVAVHADDVHHLLEHAAPAGS